MNAPLLALSHAPADREAVRLGERALSYGELRGVAAALAARIAGAGRVAMWSTTSLETCAAVAGALAAGVPLVTLNPKSGLRELEHVVRDSAPELVLCEPGAELPAALDDVPRLEVDLDARAGRLPDEPDPAAPALVIYTSGTTGPPKGALLPRRALAANVDALAQAWEWTAGDVLAHALPLFHVHGLVLGLLGPLRLGGSVRLLGRFSPAAVADALAGPATMLFGVPTMYHRIAAELADDAHLAAALRGARLLVSGSAALGARDRDAIEHATGQRVIERYGMTETLIICAARADGDRRAGSVGPPLPGVELRLVDDDGAPIAPGDPEQVGEAQVRGASLFLGYLNRPDATADAFDGEWFRTGDAVTRDLDGAVRIVGRRSVDIIKSGGYKIGAGEIEAALLEHPAIAEAAVIGASDDDLGERIVACVVAADGAARVPDDALVDHVAALLSPHKRPREIRWLDALPRNDLGKVLKRKLHG